MYIYAILSFEYVVVAILSFKYFVVHRVSEPYFYHHYFFLLSSGFDSDITIIISLFFLFFFLFFFSFFFSFFFYFSLPPNQTLIFFIITPVVSVVTIVLCVAFWHVD